MASLIPCSTCYQSSLCECLESFFLENSGLEPNHTYGFILTNKFGKEFYGQAVTDGDGKLTFEVEDLGIEPKALNRHAGVFELELYEVDDYELCSPIELTICEQTYTCFKISFKQCSGLETQSLTCNCNEED